MSGATARTIKTATAIAALYLILTCPALGQGTDSVENECDSLKNATSTDLVQFLSGVIPQERNADCVTWAIRKLGKDRYEAAIPALVTLLDFRRPPTPREKRGFIMHPPGVWDLYPAAGALSCIGKKVVPAVLEVIESASASSLSKENAVFVIMEINKYEKSSGIALLKREEVKTNEDAKRKQLRWAVQRALSYCDGSTEEAACRKAATGSP